MVKRRKSKKTKKIFEAPEIQAAEADDSEGEDDAENDTNSFVKWLEQFLEKWFSFSEFTCQTFAEENAETLLSCFQDGSTDLIVISKLNYWRKKVPAELEAAKTEDGDDAEKGEPSQEQEELVEDFEILQISEDMLTKARTRKLKGGHKRRTKQAQNTSGHPSKRRVAHSTSLSRKSGSKISTHRTKGKSIAKTAKPEETTNPESPKITAVSEVEMDLKEIEKDLAQDHFADMESSEPENMDLTQVENDIELISEPLFTTDTHPLMGAKIESFYFFIRTTPGDWNSWSETVGNNLEAFLADNFCQGFIEQPRVFLAIPPVISKILSETSDNDKNTFMDLLKLHVTHETKLASEDPMLYFLYSSFLKRLLEEEHHFVGTLPTNLDQFFDLKSAVDFSKRSVEMQKFLQKWFTNMENQLLKTYNRIFGSETQSLNRWIEIWVMYCGEIYLFTAELDTFCTKLSSIPKTSAIFDVCNSVLYRQNYFLITVVEVVQWVLSLLSFPQLCSSANQEDPVEKLINYAPILALRISQMCTLMNNYNFKPHVIVDIRDAISDKSSGAVAAETNVTGKLMEKTIFYLINREICTFLGSFLDCGFMRNALKDVKATVETIHHTTQLVIAWKKHFGSNKNDLFSADVKKIFQGTTGYAATVLQNLSTLMDDLWLFERILNHEVWDMLQNRKLIESSETTFRSFQQNLDTMNFDLFSADNNAMQKRWFHNCSERMRALNGSIVDLLNKSGCSDPGLKKADIRDFVSCFLKVLSQRTASKADLTDSFHNLQKCDRTL